MKKILCLNCFHEILPNNVYFLCPNLCRNCSLKKAKPEENKRFFKIPFLQRIKNNILAKVPLKASCPCPISKEEVRIQYSIERYCPYCLAPLHKEAGKNEEIIFSTIGMQGSGKTEILRSLEFSLWKNFSLRRVLFNKTMGNQRLEINKHSGPTPAGFVYPPQVFCLDISKSQSNMYTSIKKTFQFLMTFFDISGNEWQRGNPQVLRFLPFCSGLVVLCDPLTNPRILKILMDDLKPSDPLYTKIKIYYESSVNNTNISLKFILDEILATLNILNKKIPIALVVTKSDILRHQNLFPKDSPVHYNPSNPFIIDDLISDTITNYLISYEPEIYTILKNWHSQQHWIAYFAVSAFGQPYIDGEIESRQPIRILSPYLWMLQRLNLL